MFMLAMSSAITKSWAKWLLADNLAYDFAMIGRMPVSKDATHPGKPQVFELALRERAVRQLHRTAERRDI